jgi:hypothetical protein
LGGRLAEQLPARFVEAFTDGCESWLSTVGGLEDGGRDSSSPCRISTGSSSGCEALVSDPAGNVVELFEPYED